MDQHIQQMGFERNMLVAISKYWRVLPSVGNPQVRRVRIAQGSAKVR